MLKKSLSQFVIVSLLVPCLQENNFFVGRSMLPMVCFSFFFVDLNGLSLLNSRIVIVLNTQAANDPM